MDIEHVPMRLCSSHSVQVGDSNSSDSDCVVDPSVDETSMQGASWRQSQRQRRDLDLVYFWMPQSHVRAQRARCLTAAKRSSKPLHMPAASIAESFSSNASSSRVAPGAPVQRQQRLTSPLLEGSGSGDVRVPSGMGVRTRRPRLALVSAFLALSPNSTKFTNDEYLRWLSVFQQIANPLVFFSDAPDMLRAMLELSTRNSELEPHVENKSATITNTSNENRSTAASGDRYMRSHSHAGIGTKHKHTSAHVSSNEARDSQTRVIHVAQRALPAFRLYERLYTEVLASARYRVESANTMVASYCLTMHAKYDLLQVAIAHRVRLFPREAITHLAWIDSGYFRDLPLPVLPARRPEHTPPLPPPAVADAQQASTAASAKFDGHIQFPMYRFELVSPAQLDPSRVAFTEISNTSLDTV